MKESRSADGMSSGGHERGGDHALTDQKYQISIVGEAAGALDGAHLSDSLIAATGRESIL
jgi:hypothetical protein